MSPSPRRAGGRRFAAGAVSLLLCSHAGAVPVISEIMYRPGNSFPENTAAEFIEIHNPDGDPADLSGWAMTNGVAFVFPPGTVLAPGAYVTVAADPAAVQNAHGVAGVLGPWTGSLSNNGENLTLSEPDGAGGWTAVDSVRYASEGDWADRVVEPVFGGFAWSTLAESGKSLELRNASLPNDNGQNWTPSTAASGGTPGAANTAWSADIPPIISGVNHSPAVPLPTDRVTVTCRVEDENGAESVTAALFWRPANNAAQAAWLRIPMSRADGGDTFSAVMPPQPNGGIYEFYVSADDGAQTRLWPAPTSSGQDANCLCQTSLEAPPADASLHRLILTTRDNGLFNTLNSGSDRQFNQTLIVSRGGQSDIRYRSSVRIRGNSSRSYMFRPLRVSIPNDEPLDGVRSFNLAPRSSWVQFLGMRLFEAAGLRATYSIPVELRRNGAEQTTSANSTPDFGKWARIEELNGDFVDRAWPEADTGNLFKKGRPDQYWRATAAAPANPDLLLDGWSKQNNSAGNDWSDLTGFFQTWQANLAPHFPGAPALNTANANGSQLTGNGAWARTAFTAPQLLAVRGVSDLDQWARWFAVMTILQDNETNISNGQDDDYAVYFEPGPDGRRRMELLPHDLDTILGQGDAPLPANGRGLYDMTAEGSVFRPLLPLLGNGTFAGNAEFTLQYRTALRELLGGVFFSTDAADLSQPFNAMVENQLSGWAPADRRAALRSFLLARRAHLLTLLGEEAIPPPAATASATLTSAASAPLRLSEVLVNGGAASGWVELHNQGFLPADLTGAGLSDTAEDPHRFAFPAGATLAPGGRITVRLDNRNTPPGPRTGFPLDASGGKILFFSANGALLDSVAFGPQIANLSIARTDADSDVWALSVPTPGADNGAPVAAGGPGTARLNEWLADADFRLDADFVELRNDSAEPAALGGVSVTDDPLNAPRKFVFPPLSFLAPGGFLTLRGGGGAGPSDLPFGLNALSDDLAVLGANGAVIDRAPVINQMPGISSGRPADGGALFQRLALPTPGLSNAAPPAILALANGLRITEILYKPVGNGEATNEFVELQNMGAVPLDLEGVRFTGGLTYTFPAGTTLEPGELIVVCRDRARFTARYTDPVIRLAPGAFTGALDNGGEKLTLTLPAPFEANILSFAYDPAWEPDTENAGHSLVTTASAQTPPRDWKERAGWTASPRPGGGPGRDEPPVILSPGALGTVLGDPFSVPLLTNRPAAAFRVTGLPRGLTVNPVTGVISGAALEHGVFPLTATAENTGGTGAPAAITLTVAASGPLDHYTWDSVPARVFSGVPFPVRLTARDARDRLVLTASEIITLRAVYGGYSGPKLVISEAFDQDPDQFEITNVTADPVDTAGWFCLVNDAGSNSTQITQMSSVDGQPAWLLPNSIGAGQVFRLSENPDFDDPPFTYLYWGNIALSHTNRRRGWIMLVNGQGGIEDFVAWGLPLEDGVPEALGLTDLSVTVTVNGVTRTLNPLEAGAWSGEPPAHEATPAFGLQRQGTRDTNTAADWSWRPNSVQNFPELNIGLETPWGASSALPIFPDAVPLTGGSFTGMVTVTGLQEAVRLAAFPGAVSPEFAVDAAPADADGDGLPDAWETANGFNPGSAADAARDADGDGFSNLVEYRAGTGPRDALSYLRLTGFEMDAGAPRFTWNAAAGRIYRIAASPDLVSWTAAPESVMLPDADGPVSVRLRSAAPRAFYRLELVH